MSAARGRIESRGRTGRRTASPARAVQVAGALRSLLERARSAGAAVSPGDGPRETFQEGPLDQQ